MLPSENQRREVPSSGTTKATILLFSWPWWMLITSLHGCKFVILALILTDRSGKRPTSRLRLRETSLVYQTLLLYLLTTSPCHSSWLVGQQNHILDAEDPAHNVVPGEWREGVQMDDCQRVQGGNRDTREAKKQCNLLKHYFQGPGVVDWQERMI